MRARRAIAAAAIAFGLALAAYGLLAAGGSDAGSGGVASRLSDQGLLTLLGAGLVWLGALRLRTRGARDD